MRFLADGPDIPDELLFAQDEGKVVFFCGAGVSMEYAKLPSFMELAEMVMDDLGVDENSNAKKLFLEIRELEKKPHVNGIISVENIFTSLKNDFKKDTIYNYVTKNLEPKRKVNLKAHKIILDLAGLQKKQLKLITTNFDLLFETASENEIKSVTRSNLPNAESADDWGVVHLHGKFEADYSMPTRDGLVLLSSEFGNAYLSQGWAKDFIKDVLKKYTTVFIGYTANDPPVRYLLEGLQESGEAPHGIYAFEKNDNEAIEQWNKKEVIPIVYDIMKGNKHANLWNSLEAWSKRSKSPDSWKSEVLKKAQKGPTKLQPHERGMVAHLVKSKSGANLFERANPPMPSEWLCVFDKDIRLGKGMQILKYKNKTSAFDELLDAEELYRIDSDFSGQEPWDAFSLNTEDFINIEYANIPIIKELNSKRLDTFPSRLNHLAWWIAKIADQKITVWWAGRQPYLHPFLLEIIKRQLIHKNKNVNRIIIEAWNRIFELSEFYDRNESELYNLEFYTEAFGWSNFALSSYSRISTPILKQKSSGNKNIIPREDKIELHVDSFVDLEICYPNNIYTINIAADYLPQVVNILSMHLEKAENMENRLSGQDVIFFSHRLAHDIEYNYSNVYDFSEYVIYFSSLFRKLVDFDAEKAREEIAKWSKNSNIFEELKVWAYGLLNFSDEEDFVNEILSLSHEKFWTSRGSLDLLHALKMNWNNLSKNSINRIQDKILENPPNTDRINNELDISYYANDQLNMLHWLKNKGCELNLDLEVITKNLRKKSPRWKPKFVDKLGKDTGAEVSFIKIDENYDSLKNIPLREITRKVAEIETFDLYNHVKYNPFLGLCKERPVRAISALSIDTKENKFNASLWKTYLSSDARKDDECRLVFLTLERIIEIPNEHLKDIFLHTLSWLRNKVNEIKKIKEKHPESFECIWNKFIKIIKDYPDSARSISSRRSGENIDWVMEAHNSTPGHLSVILNETTNRNIESNRIGVEDWLEKAGQLLDLHGDSHRYAMAIFAYNLDWLYENIPEWAEEKFIKILESGEEYLEKDKNAIISGFFRTRSIYPDLYLRIKPFLITAVCNKLDWENTELIDASVLLLSGWNIRDKNKKQVISDSEMRKLLLEANSDFRVMILRHLRVWSDSKGGETKWGKKIIYFLDNVWPKQKTIIDNKTSVSLCEFAFEQSKRFPAVSQRVVKLIKRIEGENLFIRGIKTKESNDEENLAEKYPEDYLNLLYAILPEEVDKWPYRTRDALKEIEQSNPELLKDSRFIELKTRLGEL